MDINKAIKVIQEEIKRMKTVERELLNHRKPNTGERLRCATKGNTFQYYIGSRYITKKKSKMIKEMANREYREKLLPVVSEQIVHLEHLLHSCAYDFDKPEKVYANMHPARKSLVDPLIIPKEDYIRKWLEEPYEKWEITDDDVRATIYTERGERVRSKSEKIIADALLHHEIPYKYEYPLQLWNGKKIVQRRPDFLVLHRVTLEEKIIEHLGMLDSEEYYIKNMNKIDLYEKNGYLIGQRLFLLHETEGHPLDTSVMEQYLETFFM